MVQGQPGGLPSEAPGAAQGPGRKPHTELGRLLPPQEGRGASQ